MKCLKPSEHDFQKAIVQALRAAGFHVYETTAYKQKGPSGVDKGVPDLLVSHRLIRSYFVGLEVKRDTKAAVSREQKEAVAADRYIIVTDPGEAVSYCCNRLLEGTCHYSDPVACDEAQLRAVAQNHARKVAKQLLERRAA